MSDPAVTAYVTRVLCWHGGRLERGRLAEESGLPEPDIGQILREEPERFPQSDRLVLARSPLRVCPKYLHGKDGGCPETEEGEDRCPKLHLCRHYLWGKCANTRRSPCSFCHDICSDHNRAVLKTNLLTGLTEEEIRTLLFQNDSGLLPSDCPRYMKDGCDAGDECRRLHLCRHFTRGECDRRFCRRSHNMLESRVLRNCVWMSQESIQNFQTLCDLKHNERHPKSAGEDPRRGQRGRGRGGRGRGNKDMMEEMGRIIERVQWGRDQGQVFMILDDPSSRPYYSRPPWARPIPAQGEPSRSADSQGSHSLVSPRDSSAKSIASVTPRTQTAAASDPPGDHVTSPTATRPQIPTYHAVPPLTAADRSGIATNRSVVPTPYSDYLANTGASRMPSVPSSVPSVPSSVPSVPSSVPSVPSSLQSSVPPSRSEPFLYREGLRLPPSPAKSSDSQDSQSSQSSVFLGEDSSSRNVSSLKPRTQTEAAGDDPLRDQSPKPLTNPTTAQPERTTNSPAGPPTTASIEETPTICLSNIWKFCGKGGKCPDMHYYLPYCWQELHDTAWKDLPDMEEIEKAYSDPKNDSYQSINFQTMRCGAKRLRRLCTPSSATRPPEYVLTTEWIWYWKDETGQWIQYGQQSTKKTNSNILSTDLETIYLSDPTDTIPFSAGNQSYIINFKEMRQRNTHYRTEREVRRRPKFLDFDNVKMLKGSTKSSAKLANSPLKSGNFPKEWNLEDMPEVGFRKILVSENTSEFSGINAILCKTVKGHKVKRLWRIQNPSLWQLYQWQKDQMKKKNNGVEVKERRLFHGTAGSNTEQICNDNFDWRVCGTNGTVYGQGSYFARDASYSHNYALPGPGGLSTMFVASVLVGDFVVGKSAMRRPPEKPGGGLSYDSCVDNASDPSIYVVFEKFQIYPEYILEYEEERRTCCIS